MKQYKGFLIDLDGTAFLGEVVIKEALDFVNKCQEKGIKVLFITNNASKTSEKISFKMQNMGYQITADDLLTSAQITALKLTEKKGGIYVLGSDTLVQELSKRSLEVYTKLNSKQDQELIKSIKNVVVGYSQETCYEELAVASLVLQNENSYLYGTNKDLKIPTHLGILPGNGSIIELLEKVNQKEAVIFGKPSNFMIAEALKQINCSKEEVCLIGDNYHTDILGAINADIDSIFVETGVTKISDLDKKKSPSNLLFFFS